MKYFSEREIRLVSSIPNTVTVEDYCKWYSLYYINSDEKVEVIPYSGNDYTIDGADHWVYPVSVVDYLIKIGRKMDYISYLAICFRCMEDTEGGPIPEDWLPAKEILREVLVLGGEDCYCDNYYLYPRHVPFSTAINYYSRMDNFKMKQKYIAGLERSYERK